MPIPNYLILHIIKYVEDDPLMAFHMSDIPDDQGNGKCQSDKKRGEGRKLLERLVDSRADLKFLANSSKQEKGNYEKVRTVLEMLKTPYKQDYCTFKGEEGADRTISEEEAHFAKLAPTWGTSVLCTCSS